MNLVSPSFNLKAETECFSEIPQNIYQTPQDLNILVPEVSQGTECGRRCSKSGPPEYIKRAKQYTASLGHVTLLVLCKRRYEVSSDNTNAVLAASLQANCMVQGSWQVLQHPHLLWVPPSLISDGYCGPFSRDDTAGA
jgi:hypothetical protein